MLKGKILFFKEFLKDKNVASVIPTSRFCINYICSRINFSGQKIIVEYGPGNGVFSKALLKKMGSDSRLVLIETNKDFCESLLEINDSRVKVFLRGAEDIIDILKEEGIESVDYIISGIPFSYINIETRKKIIDDSWESLRPKGKMLIYQARGIMGKYLLGKFIEVKTCLKILNIPPLFIFEAKK